MATLQKQPLSAPTGKGKNQQTQYTHTNDYRAQTTAHLDELQSYSASVEIISNNYLEDEQEMIDDTSSVKPTDPIEFISTDDMVGLYLKETAKVPLLTEEEELELAKRIEKARNARNELSNLQWKGTKVQRQELFKIIQDGMKAREQLIKANTRLVVSVAKKYVRNGLPLLDLIQEGNIGLIKAIEKFDYHRGFRFSTYATWWIRQTITRAIADHGRTIRLPVHMHDRIRLVNKTKQSLEQTLGRPPTLDELSESLDMPEEKLQWIFQVARFPLSLETPIGDENEDHEIGTMIEDVTTPDPPQLIYQSMLKEKINEILSTLTPREARIIRLRFGIDQNHPYTLEELGQKFGLTRERIRQIEGKALRRLRHPNRSHALREYI